MIRLLIVLIIVFFHKEIYDFFISKNINSITGIEQNFKKKNKKLENYIQAGGLNDSLGYIKKFDRKIYKECKVIIKDIKYLRNLVISGKNPKINYENIKFQRKRIMNILSSMIVNFGFLENHKEIKKDIDNFIKKILREILNYKKNDTKTIEWFQENELIENDFIVEPNDYYFNPHYDIY
jgi:hypothetical protein